MQIAIPSLVANHSSPIVEGHSVDWTVNEAEPPERVILGIRPDPLIILILIYRMVYGVDEMSGWFNFKRNQVAFIKL